MGTVLARYDGVSAYVAVAGVKSISGPGLSADVTDITTLTSSGNWEEALATVKRSGEVSMGISWVPDDTGHVAILGDLGGAAVNYQIQFQDTGTTIYQFACIVTGLSISSETTSEVQAELTLKITGAPNFDA